MKNLKDSAMECVKKMNDVKISESIRFSTDMYNKNEKTKSYENEISFSFSAMQGVIAALASITVIAVSVCLLKKCEKKKILKKINKKYLLVPISECAPKNECSCEKNAQK